MQDFLGPTQTGLTKSAIVSPLKEDAPGGLRIDNCNVKVLPNSFNTADLDTEANTGFVVPALTSDLMVRAPVGKRAGRKLTLTITQGAGAHVVGWDVAYLFAQPGGVGVTAAQFNALLASMANGQILEIGFEYNLVRDRYLAVGLCGPF